MSLKPLIAPVLPEPVPRGPLPAQLSPRLARPRSGPTEIPAGLTRPTFLGATARPRTLSIALRVSVPLLLLCAWWYGSTSGRISQDVLASPAQVVAAGVELWESGQLSEFALASLQRAITGVSLGVLVGLSLGIASGLSSLGEELVDPTMQMLRAVPFLALVPLFISWFGIDDEFKVVLIASSSTMPMYAYSYLGVRNVDRKVIEAARGFGLRGAGLLFAVILPSALPHLLMALRICLAISVVGLIAAEQVGTTKGIGYLVLLAKQYYRPDYMLLCVMLYAVLGLAFDSLIRGLERWCMPWRRYSVVRG
jgi:sulfonate transport system permease protein